MSGHNEQPMTPIATTKRMCLKCGKPFASEGIGNRVCHKCNKANESADRPARRESIGCSQSVDSIMRQVKLTNHGTGVE